MNIGIVIPGILTLFLSVWAFLVARDPRQWRLWWMSLLGALDYNTPTEIKRRQEGQMAKAAWVMCLLMALTGLSCLFWTVEHFRYMQHMELRNIRRSDLELQMVKEDTLRLK